MPVVKLSYNNDTRLCVVEDFQSLKNNVVSLFGIKDFQVKFADREDVIKIGSGDELSLVFEAYGQKGPVKLLVEQVVVELPIVVEQILQPVVKVEIAKSVEEKQSPVVVNEVKQNPSPIVEEPKSRAHLGITCDGCQTTPIVGNRFKCSVCPDFDLCESCEEKQEHPVDHFLIKFREPKERRGHGRFHQFLKEAGVHHGGRGRMREFLKEAGVERPCMREFFKGAQKPCEGRKHLKDFLKEAGVDCRHGGLRRFLFEKSAPIESKEEQKENKPKENKPQEVKILLPLHSKFISDVNFADGSVVRPFQKINKIWKVANDGSLTWPEDVSLVVEGESVMDVSDFVVPKAKAGQEVEISVNLFTPIKPGVYKTVFSLSSKGVSFGHKMWAEVAVKESVEEKSVKSPLAKEVKEEPKKVEPKKEEVMTPESILESMGFKVDVNALSLLESVKGDIARILDKLL
jgi:hypothetical protein